LRVVYVAGPLFGPNDWEIRRNIHRAASLGYEVAKLGAYPVIPHTNTGSVFIGTMSPEFWYAGTLELLRRCDAIILVSGWEESRGAVAEIAEAKRLNMPVFERVEELKTWLALLPPPDAQRAKATAFDAIVAAGKALSEGGEAFVAAVDDIVESTRVGLGEIPDPRET